MNKVYLSLGSNRGDRISNLDKARISIEKKLGKIVAGSFLYETPPWKMKDETDFINQVLLLETIVPVEQVMDAIIQMEERMGRVRTQKKYESRIIDIDILFFNGEIIHTDKLVIPHPLMQQRRFVLEPMAEIAPEFVHPVFKKNILRLLEECSDKSNIKKLVIK